MGSEIAQKVLAIRQSEEVSISSEEVWFLGYVVFSKSIRMEDEQIEALK